MCFAGALLKRPAETETVFWSVTPSHSHEKMKKNHPVNEEVLWDSTMMRRRPTCLRVAFRFRWSGLKPPLVTFPPPSFHCAVEEKTEGRGGHRWSYGLSVWCLGRISETERGRAGCVRVKGKGVEKKRVMCSFPFLLCSVAPGVGFSKTSPSRTLPWHWKVCENSAHKWMWERRKQG